MKYIFTSFFLPVFLLLLYSCTGGNHSSRDTKEPEKNAAHQNASPNTAAACNATNAINVTVTDTKSAYARDNKEVEWTLRSTRAFRMENESLISYVMFLANFDFAPSSYEEALRVKPAKGQAVIRIHVNYYEEHAGNMGLPMPPGLYDVNNEHNKNYQHTGTIEIIGKNGTVYPLTKGKIKGQLEVTKADQQEICGKMNLEDPVLSVKADFSAMLKN